MRITTIIEPTTNIQGSLGEAPEAQILLPRHTMLPYHQRQAALRSLRGTSRFKVVLRIFKTSRSVQ